jgi:hypothetical protein
MQVRLANGEVLNGELDSFLGSPETPFTEDGLKIKFARLVQDEVPHLKTSLFADLMKLEDFKHISELALT